MSVESGPLTPREIEKLTQLKGTAIAPGGEEIGALRMRLGNAYSEAQVNLPHDDPQLAAMEKPWNTVALPTTNTIPSMISRHAYRWAQRLGSLLHIRE